MIDRMWEAADWLLGVTVGLALAALAGHCLAQTPAQTDASPVFEVQDLFESVRIPNIVVGTDGTVLAFAKSGSLLRRSQDGGKTWSPLQKVGHDVGGSAIVDDNTGEVIIVHSGRGHLWRSRDQGKNWHREQIVVRPNPLGHGTPDGIPAHTGCSESGVTLRYGKHKGRLLMPARV